MLIVEDKGDDKNEDVKRRKDSERVSEVQKILEDLMPRCFMCFFDGVPYSRFSIYSQNEDLR